MSKKLWGILFIIIIICIGINYKSILKMLYPIQYESIVEKYSNEYQLDSYMVYSLIRVESKFNPYAKSSKAAKGLMQITPQTGNYIATLIGNKNFNNDNLYDPELNIKYGCFYFSKLLRDFDGSLNCAIAAYNGGEGNVRKWMTIDKNGKKSLNIEDVQFSETKQYMKRVNKYYEIYKFLYSNDTQNGIPNFLKLYLTDRGVYSQLSMKFSL